MSARNRKQPRPWYRPGRRLWYLTLDGKQINLGPDEELAHQQYFEIMATRAKDPDAPARPDNISLAEVIEEFLEFMSRERAPETYEAYRYRLKRLHDCYPRIAVSELRPIDVRKWVDGYDYLSKTSRRNYMRSIKTCLKWAAEEGLIQANPIANLRIPTAEAREVYVPPNEFESILALIRDDSLRDLMVVTYETGCRPQESLIVEGSQVDVPNQRWVFRLSESKMKRISRIVYMSDVAMDITRRWTLKYPSGPIFRNSNGRPWTTDAVNNGFTRLQYRMAQIDMRQRGEEISDDAIADFVPTLSPTRKRRGKLVDKTPAELRHEAKTKLTYRWATQNVTRYSLYALRHSWATNALKRDVDSLTVAVLMGHRDPSMLAKVYQHLNQDPQHLLDMARKAAG